MSDTSSFEGVGLSNEHWSNASAIRKIFKEAFDLAGQTGFNPHSFRNTLASLGEKVCRSPEEFKAWSQNLGHERVLTTFISYGEVQESRQAEIFNSLQGVGWDDQNLTADCIADALMRRLGVRGQFG